ncbi:MAG: type II secretion system minor pseudopilin GspI [Gammaproteobacteria bacterium]|jgi:general secretion pathway protein I|nr:type II secretion system minor pseudopilin GspI [Gammaproteobacteria bacterium]
MAGQQRQPRSNCRGFTLIEVLVAMAVLSFGMIAIFAGLSQSLSVTSRLRDKTLASWIATDQIVELQVTGEYPEAGNRHDQVKMARNDWVYDLQITNIPQLDMRRIDVTVSFADSPDDILATVIGFIGPPQSPAATPGLATEDRELDDGFGAGWEPPQEDFGALE